MNKADSEAMTGQLLSAGYTETSDCNEADVIILNTCSVRKTAENRIWGRLGFFKKLNKNEAYFMLAHEEGHRQDRSLYLIVLLANFFNMMLALFLIFMIILKEIHIGWLLTIFLLPITSILILIGLLSFPSTVMAEEEKAFNIVSKKAVKLGYKKVLKVGVAIFLYGVKHGKNNLEDGLNVLLWSKPGSASERADKLFTISQILEDVLIYDLSDLYGDELVQFTIIVRIIHAMNNTI